MKKWEDDGFVIEIASDKHGDLAEGIGRAMSESAAQRGTGIGGRTPEFIRRKMRDHRAIIATSATGEWAGFCYYDVYEGGKYVSQSGLIVAPQFRGQKLAVKLKTILFRLCRRLFPNAKLFGITTGSAVMRMNGKLGFQPVGFELLTQDPGFWEGCKLCRHHDILKQTGGKYCLCTGMLFEPQ